MIQNFSNKTVIVLSGGFSSEAEISKKSGEGVFNELSKAGYKVKNIDPIDKKQLSIFLTNKNLIAFNCLHGQGGEDGKIQGFLETLNIPYTGSGILSNSICINKIITKGIYTSNDIPTPDYFVLNPQERNRINHIYQKLKSEVVVKLPKEGSSIGIYIPRNINEYYFAIDNVCNSESEILIEKYILGKEYTVAVLDINNKPTALPVIEITPKNNSYDFESKYKKGGSVHTCPARINVDLANKLKEYAIRAHKALFCEGVSRTDFIIDSKNNIWTLETNTIPGMTETSLLPDAGKVAGYSYLDICEILLKNAISKYTARF